MIRTVVLTGVLSGIIIGLIPTTLPMAVNEDSADLRYAPSMQIDEVMNHLNALQNIATAANGNRAVKTVGFNRTLDYITEYLSSNTNFKVTQTFFPMRNSELLRNPTLSSVINGVTKTYYYSTNLASADFYQVQYTTSVSLTSNVRLTAIANLGCSDDDWLAAQPAPAGLVALVKRGDCSFEMKALLATKYKVAALLFYNHGIDGNTRPVYFSLGKHNQVPALSLSSTVGEALVNAANNPSQLASVRLTISTDTALNPVGNICADTPTGDPSQTILVGSHSDSVTAGPGINDNGSGSAANLALAATLSRLLQTSNYAPYNYRLRFCWWGAEELGLLGSDFHAAEAKRSTVVGERISDYLVNINLDMLGSPNFIFGIYDGKTATSSTPAVAKPGSNKMTALFQGWFTDNKLPYDYTSFDGRSDYGPFLAAGIAAGGLFSGADGVKTMEQRNRYNAILGSNLGGTSGIRQDACYHKACDKTTNINKFALNKMVQAAAYAVENLGRQTDLRGWLYPAKEIQQIERQATQQQQCFEYNSINEYFGLSYN